MLIFQFSLRHNQNTQLITIKSSDKIQVHFIKRNTQQSVPKIVESW